MVFCLISSPHVHVTVKKKVSGSVEKFFRSENRRRHHLCQKKHHRHCHQMHLLRADPRDVGRWFFANGQWLLMLLDIGISWNGGTPKSSIEFRIFHEINHPASLGYPHFWKQSHVGQKWLMLEACRMMAVPIAWEKRRACLSRRDANFSKHWKFYPLYSTRAFSKDL